MDINTWVTIRQNIKKKAIWKDGVRDSILLLTIRRYAGINHEKVYRLPTMWMCDKCYKKLALKMSFPPYEEGEEE
jgi:hypothetical protein